jgi:hypothetical protein
MTQETLERGNQIKEELFELKKIKEVLADLRENGISDKRSVTTFDSQAREAICFKKTRFSINFPYFPDLAEKWEQEYLRACFFQEGHVDAKIKKLEDEFNSL